MGFLGHGHVASPAEAQHPPLGRLRTALRDIYRFFAEVEPLFLLGSADMPKLPKLQEADAPVFTSPAWATTIVGPAPLASAAPSASGWPQT